jgi:hypothetical protein
MLGIVPNWHSDVPDLIFNLVRCYLIQNDQQAARDFWRWALHCDDYSVMLQSGVEILASKQFKIRTIVCYQGCSPTNGIAQLFAIASAPLTSLLRGGYGEAAPSHQLGN